MKDRLPNSGYKVRPAQDGGYVVEESALEFHMAAFWAFSNKSDLLRFLYEVHNPSSLPNNAGEGKV